MAQPSTNVVGAQDLASGAPQPSPAPGRRYPDAASLERERKQADWTKRGKELERAFLDARGYLLLRRSFFGRLAMRMEYRFSEQVEIAAVRADWTCLLNPHVFEKLDIVERAFLIGHEICHPAFQHFERQGKRDSRLWNRAGDYMINSMLVESGLPMIQSVPGLYDPKYKDWSDTQIYADLEREREKQISQGRGDSGQGQSGQSGQSGQGDSDQEQSRGQSGQEQPGGGSGQEQPGGGSGDEEGGPIGSMMGGDCDFDSLPDLQRKSRDGTGRKVPSMGELRRTLVSAARAAQGMQPGSVPAGFERLIAEMKDPEVPWTEVLAQWAGSQFPTSRSYRRPHRHSASLRGSPHVPAHIQPIMPSKRPGMPVVTVVIDASASRDGTEDIAEDLGEINELLSIYSIGMRVITHDTVVQNDQQVYDVSEIEVKGGGGTACEQVIEYLEENPGMQARSDVVVWFSDLEMSYPDEPPSCDILWVYVGDPHREIPQIPDHMGQVVRKKQSEALAPRGMSR